jgi:transcriptional regulator with XRE-family HTH domain
LAGVAFFDTRSVRRGSIVDQKVSVSQIEAARVLLGWSQADLANAAGVSEPTIKRLEAGESVRPEDSATVERAQAALERGGIAFFFENESSPRGGPGVRLKPSQTDEGLRPDQLTSENDG